MKQSFRIGTRESELAIWQATLVKDLLAEANYSSQLEYIKSEGDIDLNTPLYEMGVQGIFTKTLDIALLNNRVDIAVHSMKDVPTLLPKGIVQAAVLKRGNHKDLFVPNKNMWNKNGKWQQTAGYIKDMPGKIPMEDSPFTNDHPIFKIATSSIRRKAQWLHRFPDHLIENLRGNVNTRLHKLEESDWQGAIFAAAGLERIHRRPADAIELDWMLPAPAQGAIMVVCREGDEPALEACIKMNDEATAVCAKTERDFLRELLGGCSTPISAFAEMDNNDVFFKGNILSTDGTMIAEIERHVSIHEISGFGNKMAQELLNNGGKEIASHIKNVG